MDDLWVIEYSWTQDQYHYEPLITRLRKNRGEILHEGKPRNPNWIPMVVCEEKEIAKKLGVLVDVLKDRKRLKE